MSMGLIEPTYPFMHMVIFPVLVSSMQQPLKSMGTSIIILLTLKRLVRCYENLVIIGTFTAISKSSVTFSSSKPMDPSDLRLTNNFDNPLIVPFPCSLSASFKIQLPIAGQVRPPRRAVFNIATHIPFVSSSVPSVA